MILASLFNSGIIILLTKAFQWLDLLSGERHHRHTFSYFVLNCKKKICLCRDSNSQPSEWQPDTLPLSYFGWWYLVNYFTIPIDDLGYTKMGEHQNKAPPFGQSSHWWAISNNIETRLKNYFYNRKLFDFHLLGSKCSNHCQLASPAMQ